MRSPLRFFPVAIVVVVLSVIAFAGTSRAQGSGYWSLIRTELPAGLNINDAFMTHGSDAVWIAADNGVQGMAVELLRSSDATSVPWRTISRDDFRAPLRSIVAIADDNVWAVGDDGLILHRNQYGWEEMSNPVPNADLTRIQMFGDGAEGWATGTRASTPEAQLVVLHYQSGAWTRTDPVAIDPSITLQSADLHFNAGTGYLVAGYQGWRFGNGVWNSDTTFPCDSGGFYCRTRSGAVRTLGENETWVAGWEIDTHTPNSTPVLWHRQGQQWSSFIAPSSWEDVPGFWALQSAEFHGLSFVDSNHGFAVGFQQAGPGAARYPLAVSFRTDGRWHYENLPDVGAGQLNAVSQSDANHAIAVGSNSVVMGYGYSNVPPPSPTIATPTGSPTPAGGATATSTPTSILTPLATSTPTMTPIPGTTATPWPPTTRRDDPHLPGVSYFAETGHTLQGAFKAYWEAHGGLAQFGYPITEEYPQVASQNGQTYTTQYFQRARFEYHPENQAPYDVLLGLLGNESVIRRRDEIPFLPAADAGRPGGLYFAETRHNMAPELLNYWRTTGGLPVYGYPISEPFTEASPTDGKNYLVQYFERNRLEYHPEYTGTPNVVLLGLLGSEQLRARGWLP